MPRVIEITVPSKESQKLLDEIQKEVSDLIGIRIQKGVSVYPKGDVLTIEVTDKKLPELMRLLSRNNIGNRSNTSISSSESLSVISASSYEQILEDTNESSWEEAEQTLTRESNTTPNMLLVMFCVGAIAAIGITSNALHIVIGAMVIAPAFEPILRIPLSIVTARRVQKKDILAFLKMYLSLIFGAIAATIFIAAYTNGAPFGFKSSYIEQFELISYWSQVSVFSVVISALASIAGVLLVISNRSVLSSGVMIALALVPAATLFGVGLVHQDIVLMASSASRWLVDAVLVILAGLGIAYWKKYVVHKRSMLPERKG